METVILGVAAFNLMIVALVFVLMAAKSKLVNTETHPLPLSSLMTEQRRTELPTDDCIDCAVDFVASVALLELVEFRRSSKQFVSVAVSLMA